MPFWGSSSLRISWTRRRGGQVGKSERRAASKRAKASRRRNRG